MHYCFLIDPVTFRVKEKARVVLNFSEPRPGVYEEISWNKGKRTGGDYRVVLMNPDIKGGTPQYYHDYCSGFSPCDTSSKGELDTGTGDLTIYSANISDINLYFYDFYMKGNADTGYKYEITLGSLW